MMRNEKDNIQIGRRNLFAMYGFTAASRLWFDGGLWVVYFQHDGISLFQIGVLEAILHLAAVVSDVPIGILADRFGWKKTLACGTLLGIVYTLMALFAHAFWLIAIAFAARGLQITCTNGSDASILYESTVWVGEKERYLVISGRVYAIALVSMGIAEVFGGSLAQQSWSLVYIAYTAANVLSFIIVGLIHEPRNAAPTTIERRSSAYRIMLDAILFARQSRPFLAWILLGTTVSGFTATFLFYGQSMLLHAGWSLIGIGVLAGIENGFGAIVSWKAHAIVSRFGKVHVVSGASGMAAGGLVLFSWLPGLMMSAGYLLNSLAINLVDPIIDQSLNKLVPSEQRATLLSANSTGFSLFMIFFFPLFGELAERVGLVDAARFVSLVSVVMIGMITIWWRRCQERPSFASSERIFMK